MNYKEEIMKLIDRIDDKGKLEYLYTFVKLLVERLL